MSAHAYPPLRYDFSGAVLADHGLAASDLVDLSPQLDAARREMLESDEQLFAGPAEAIPAEKQPLDAGYFSLPERILAAYEKDPSGSELGRILSTAQRIRDAVDRVVVLGIGGSYMGARALFEACCHPYHNELSRGERGGRPRLYFEGNNVDNDFSQGLLDVLAKEGGTADPQDRWAIVVISKSGGTMETAVAFRQYLAALKDSVAGDLATTAGLVVPVTGTSGKLFDLARAIGCKEVFHVPDGVGGRFSVLSAVGLLPAAILGLDVVALLQGAAQMNEHFRTAGPSENIVMQYVGVSHLLEAKCGVVTRVLSSWSKGLEAAGLWYDQLLAESLGKQGKGALPLTIVNTRDLHSRGQQHQEGPRDKVITNLIVENWRRNPLAVGNSDLDQDQLNQFADKTLPEIMTAAIKGTNQAYLEDHRPTTNLTLPTTDEATLGQLFQFFMIATVLEGRLIGINPYGQPGVEAYKKHMKANLNG